MVKTNRSFVCQAEASRTLQVAECDQYDCCDQVYCSTFNCDVGYELKPNHAEIPPRGTVTSLDECCDQVFCSSFGCDAGYVLKEDHATIVWEGYGSTIGSYPWHGRIDSST